MSGGHQGICKTMILSRA